jgi:transcriptional regulator with XRE-family HTH domain
MDDIQKNLKKELQDPETRRDYAEEFLNAFIALQVKTLRQQREWSQEDLAERAGMKQSRISAMEQVDYSSWSVRTLRRLAQAFDLALIVKFESFGKFLDDVARVSREELERPSFAEDPAFRSGSPRTAPEPSRVDCSVPSVLQFPDYRQAEGKRAQITAAPQGQDFAMSSDLIFEESRG